jgi:uncharacterized membrane protein YgcG
VLFWVYVFLMFFILMSVFIALISEAYEEAKGELKKSLEPGLHRKVVDDSEKQVELHLEAVTKLAHYASLISEPLYAKLQEAIEEDEWSQTAYQRQRLSKYDSRYQWDRLKLVRKQRQGKDAKNKWLHDMLEKKGNAVEMDESVLRQELMAKSVEELSSEAAALGIGEDEITETKAKQGEEEHGQRMALVHLIMGQQQRGEGASGGGPRAGGGGGGGVGGGGSRRVRLQKSLSRLQRTSTHGRTLSRSAGSFKRLRWLGCRRWCQQACCHVNRREPLPCPPPAHAMPGARTLYLS